MCPTSSPGFRPERERERGSSAGAASQWGTGGSSSFGSAALCQRRQVPALSISFGAFSPRVSLLAPFPEEDTEAQRCQPASVQWAGHSIPA